MANRKLELRLPPIMLAYLDDLAEIGYGRRRGAVARRFIENAVTHAASSHQQSARRTLTPHLGRKCRPMRHGRNPRRPGSTGLAAAAVIDGVAVAYGPASRRAEAPNRMLHESWEE